MLKFSLHLRSGIALGLGLPERHFEQAENGGTTEETSYWVTRVLHYPPICQGDAHRPELASRAAKVGPLQAARPARYW